MQSYIGVDEEDLGPQNRDEAQPGDRDEGKPWGIQSGGKEGNPGCRVPSRTLPLISHIREASMTSTHQTALSHLAQSP